MSEWSSESVSEWSSKWVSGGRKEDLDTQQGSEQTSKLVKLCHSDFAKLLIMWVLFILKKTTLNIWNAEWLKWRMAYSFILNESINIWWCYQTYSTVTIQIQIQNNADIL